MMRAPLPYQPADASLSDEEVIRRVLAGETALFEILLRRYNQRIYRAVRGILRDEAECEDAMQQAYVAAYTHLAQFAGQAQFSTWLTRIAINEALGRIKSRKRFVELVDDNVQQEGERMQPAPNPEARAAEREMAGVLEAAVDTLPDIYRSVFVLREVEELSTAETAACLEVSEEAVKVRLHRAKNLIREEMYRQVGSVATQAYPFFAPRCDRVVAGVFERLSKLAP